MQQTGKLLLIIGGALLLAGVILILFGNKLSFLGRLPGDIRVEKENLRFYFPITTMILISVVLNFIWWMVRRFL